MSNSNTVIDSDIVIIGGGIAGLWLLNRLQRAGYQALLLESDTLGGGQSVASQGMIHGGIKYALSGALNGASEAIAAMPDHWRDCLANNGDVDIRNTNVLSDHFYLWSTRSLTSRLSSFFASKMTRGRVENVNKQHGPSAFNDPAFRGNLYKLADLVLDVPSLMNNLADNCPGRVAKIDWQQAQWQHHSDGSIDYLQLNPNTRIRAQRYVLTAGAGNQKLLQDLKLDKPAMQRRPLHQALFKHSAPHAIYAHCMGSNPSPRLTVSSHPTKDGKWVWYLGGDLATEGVDMSEGQLIDAAKKEIDSLFPWIDFGENQWATFRVDRAEPKQQSLLKPDEAYAHGNGQVITAWPTKLTLAPDMSNKVMALLEADNIQASAAPLSDLALPRPGVTVPLWQQLF